MRRGSPRLSGRFFFRVMKTYKLHISGELFMFADDAGLRVLRTEQSWVMRNGYLCLPTRHQVNPSCGIHRIIALAKAGDFVDHANGNRLDNRVCNLRLCTHAENMRNRKLNANSTSGVKGVYQDGNKWRAEAKYKKKKYHLGAFLTLEEAREARLAFDRSTGDSFLLPPEPLPIDPASLVDLGDLRTWLRSQSPVL